MTDENGCGVEREKLDFIARVSDVSKGVRAYVHKSCNGGFNEKDNEGFNGAYRHLWDVWPRYCKQTDALCSGDCKDYSLGMIWHDGKFPVIDFFRYSVLHEDGWNGNPEVHSFVFKNGVYSPLEPISCGQGLIILGEEERFRRTTSCFNQYLKSHIEIEGLRDLESDLVLY